MTPARTERVLLGIGSNLGDRRGVMAGALLEISGLPRIHVDAVSPLYESAAWGGPSGQGRFLNAVACLTADEWEPRAFLAVLLEVETRSGRIRTVKNGPRTLDLDILLWGDRVVCEPGLNLPHPDMHRRSFVLRPAIDVAADWRHPLLRATIAFLASDLVLDPPVSQIRDKDWCDALVRSER